MTRYALYFAPRSDSPWWKAGCLWLGRDPISGAELQQPEVPGLPRLLLAKLTSDARRYGFHATLKAPFRLQSGFTEAHLLAMAEAFCAAQRPLYVPDVEIGMVGRSAPVLALRAAGDTRPIDDLAQRCVHYFDLLRAAPTADEQRKYRARGLNAREEELLQRWGYPYTEECFRFHLSLSDSLAELGAEPIAALQAAAKEHFAHAHATEPLGIDGLTIFREVERGAPFQAWKSFSFNARVRNPAMPRSGRLFYFADAERMRREVLLEWVRKHMPVDTEMAFAQQTITHPVPASECHEPVDETTFWQLAAAGHFAMIWQAGGLCYGIRRGIEVDLKIGRDVIVNGAAGYVDQLRRKFPDALVIWLDGAAGGAIAAPRAEPAADAVISGSAPDGAGALHCGSGGQFAPS
ncbi:MAG TPA: DUF1045 domain-containing protein [Paucimonas sp.]|nr:DUF1045 domain-containing protein [Paucimonas sp.]